MNKIQIIVLVFIASFFFAKNISAQTTRFKTTEKKEIIDSIIFQYNDKYVFPEVAKLMEKDLLKRYRAGEYDKIQDKNVFADSLKSHLFKVSNDKHIGVSYNSDLANQLRTPKAEEDPVAKFNRVNERARKINYGFDELKIMDGNIGYFKIGAFAPTEYGGKTASSAMGFLANCDAIIFDVRNNFGGDESMVQLLISYLYSGETVHLNDFYHRKEDKTKQLWTLPYVEGKRMPDVPVYVLTNKNTISAGEEFTYDLKHLNRAVIIGETTAGAANFGEEFVAKGDFVVWVPTGRAINPITKTNWEGKGVVPDVKVDPEKALEVAHRMALEKLGGVNTTHNN